MAYVVVFIFGAFLNKGITVGYVIAFVIGALILKAIKKSKEGSGRSRSVDMSNVDISKINIFDDSTIPTSSASSHNTYTEPHKPDSHGNTSPDTSCIYCDSSWYGHGCAYSPTGYHKHNADEDHCEDCGSVFYGHGCVYNETKNHKHGIGGGKCRWCGSQWSGYGCTHSPSKYHEK